MVFRQQDRIAFPGVGVDEQPQQLVRAVPADDLGGVQAVNIRQGLPEILLSSVRVPEQLVRGGMVCLDGLGAGPVGRFVAGEFDGIGVALQRAFALLIGADGREVPLGNGTRGSVGHGVVGRVRRFFYSGTLLFPSMHYILTN